ncbi:MAG: hypothetical protein ACRCY4_04455 [Brevinema sp.]
MTTRNMVSFAAETHPLMIEMPEELRTLWFKQYQNKQTGEHLFLAMERILENPEQKNSPFADILTFEIADTDDLTEWEEDNPGQKFVALEPSHAFYEGDTTFTIGAIDEKTMLFTPEVVGEFILEENGFILDLQGERSTWTFVAVIASS